MRVMKMQLLIVSLLFFSGCGDTEIVPDKLEDYEFYSLHGIGKEINVSEHVNIIENLKNSYKVKGPVIGIDVKTMRLVNKKKLGDTLEIVIYGKNNKFFRIGDDFYMTKNSVLSENK
jgi:Cu2+-containing amine oxidase